MKKIPYRVRALYDPGTASPLEDRFVAAPPFFAVFDGVSGLYDPSIGPREFDGRSGGRRVVDLAVAELERAAPTDTVEMVLERINSSVRTFAKKEGLDLDEPADLPGTEFAIVKISDAGMEFVQGGDTLIAWQYIDGTIDATKSQTSVYETGLMGKIAELMHKNGGNRAAFWKDYIPFAREERRQHANQGTSEDYVVLDGDPRVLALSQKKVFTHGELKRVMLFSDGLADLAEMGDETTLAATLFKTLDERGIGGLCERVRSLEEKQKGIRHIDQAEATALVIEFF